MRFALGSQRLLSSMALTSVVVLRYADVDVLGVTAGAVRGLGIDLKTVARKLGTLGREILKQVGYERLFSRNYTGAMFRHRIKTQDIIWI